MSLLQDMHQEVQLLSRLAFIESSTLAPEEVQQEEVLLPQDSMVLALLVTSCCNLVLLLLAWTQLLYSSCSQTSCCSCTC